MFDGVWNYYFNVIILKKVMTFCLFKYGTYIYVVYENTSIISKVEAYIVGSYFLVTGCTF